MAVLASTAAYVFRGWENPPLTIAGALCTFIAITLPIREARKRENALKDAKEEAQQDAQAADARAELASANASAHEKRRLCSILEPLARELVGLTGKVHADSDETKRHFKKMVAHVIAPKMGEGVRLSFFKYEVAPQRRLVFDEISHGRDGNPDAVFSRKAKPGRTVLERMLNINKPPIFVANVQDPAEEEDVESSLDWHSRCQYESFAAAAIRCSGQNLVGMVTLDSPNQGTLTREDADILAVISHLIAAGYQAAEKTVLPENQDN